MNYNDSNAELAKFEGKEIIKLNYGTRLEANKLQSKMDFQLETMQRKSMFKEAERQLQKAQVDVVKVREDGAVIVQTKNLRVDTKARYVLNAEFPTLTNVKKMNSDNHRLFLFEASVNGKHAFAFLKADGISDGSYLLRKLGSVGVCVFADTQSEKKKLIVNLMFSLRVGELSTISFPESRGWYRDETGKIEFFDGKFTWQEAVECAR